MDCVRDEHGLIRLSRTQRGVSIRSRAYAQSATSGAHTHSCTQLGVCRGKALSFRVGPRLWMIPPGAAFYAPAGVVHEVQANTSFEVESLFFAAQDRSTPGFAGIVPAKPLLTELVCYLVQAGNDDTRPHAIDEAIALVYELLEVKSALPVQLPMPTDRRLLRIANGLIENPMDRRSLDEWADAAGASARSVTRLFPRETGMTFREWHQTLRLTEGIRRLMEGASVIAAAAEVGYESSGAFIAMFKRVTGMTPGRYMRELAATYPGIAGT